MLGYDTNNMKGQTITLRSIHEKKLLKVDETLNTVAYVECHKGCNSPKLGRVIFRVKWFQMDYQQNITVDRGITAANLRIASVIYVDTDTVI
jgi:hypothetical protein